MSAWSDMGFSGLSEGLKFGFNQLGNIFNSRRQWNYNKKAMDYQYQLNEQAAKNSFDRSIQAWNMENEYNTPAAQMERFQAAGLNPNLIYGQSNQGAGLTAPEQKGVSGNSVGQGTNSTFDVIRGMQEIQQMSNMREQQKLMEAERELKRAGIRRINQDISESMIRTGNMMTRTAKSEFDLQLAREMRTDVVNNLIARNRLLGLQESKLNYDIKFRRREWEDYRDWSVRPQDPLLYRILLRLFGDDSEGSFINRLDKKVKRDLGNDTWF